MSEAAPMLAQQPLDLPVLHRAQGSGGLDRKRVDGRSHRPLEGVVFTPGTLRQLRRDGTGQTEDCGKGPCPHHRIVPGELVTLKVGIRRALGMSGGARQPRGGANEGAVDRPLGPP
jgi:hypothetical protein